MIGDSTKLSVFYFELWIWSYDINLFLNSLPTVLLNVSFPFIFSFYLIFIPFFTSNNLFKLLVLLFINKPLSSIILWLSSSLFISFLYIISLNSVTNSLSSLKSLLILLSILYIHLFLLYFLIIFYSHSITSLYLL